MHATDKNKAAGAARDNAKLEPAMLIIADEFLPRGRGFGAFDNLLIQLGHELSRFLDCGRFVGVTLKSSDKYYAIASQSASDFVGADRCLVLRISSFFNA